jgi:ABC-type transport system involved in multi-copper enzyme maturation permease subunit
MRALILAELRKALSTRLGWALLVGAALTAGLFSLVAGAIARVADPRAASGPASTLTLANTIAVCSLFALVNGIVAMTGEFRHRTISTSYVTAPSRERLLAAKATVATAAGATFGLVVVLAGVPAALLGHGLRQLPDPGRLVAVCALGIVVCAVWGAFGVAIGAVIDNQLLALIGALGYFLLVETLLTAVFTGARTPAVAHYLPGDVAGAALAALAEDRVTVFGPPGLPPWWLGLLLFLGYVAAAGWIGVVIARRRDIT